MKHTLARPALDGWVDIIYRGIPIEKYTKEEIGRILYEHLRNCDPNFEGLPAKGLK